ncbi:MAG: nitroreductase family protein [Clostridia bacterium]|nr:nitroreductase family protein [Clostridia bacterium]
MNVYDAIMERRTIRKFTQEKIETDKLIKLVDCARMAAYGANLQPLKFMIIQSKEILDELFDFIKWAGYLENGAPMEEERPTAYIAVLGDCTLKASGNYEVEAGAAVTTMMLAAQEEGLATCWLGAINREKIKQTLKLEENLSVVYLLALGYPAQKSVADKMTDSVKYYLDKNNVLHVPKRSLDEVLVKCL